LLNHCSGQRYFPWPNDLQFAAHHAPQVLSRTLAAPKIPFYVSAQVAAPQEQPTNWVIPEYPATRLFPMLPPQPNQPLLLFNVNSNERTIGQAGVASGGVPSPDVGLDLGQLVIQKIYRFLAERMSIGVGPYGTSSELSPDARN